MGQGCDGPPVLSGASADEAAAYLVLHFGDGWRLDQGWSRLVIAQPSAPLPPGFELTEADDGDAVLERRGAGQLRLAFPWQATRLAHALSVPLDDLVASFEHPRGLPSFPQ